MRPQASFLQTYPYSELMTTNKKLPEDVDRCHLEVHFVYTPFHKNNAHSFQRHLNQEDFEKLFGMTPIEFYKCSDWKRINMKRKVKLF